MQVQIGRGSDDQVGRMVMRGTTMLLGGRIARILFTLLGIAVLARLLTPADFGVVAVASMILPLSIALLDGLIDVPTIREDGLDRSGLANLIWVGVVLMGVLCAAIWLAAPGLAVLLNSPRLDEALRVLCFGLLVQPFISASYALLRREHRFGMVAIFVAVSGAAYMLLAIGLALMGLGVWSLIIGQIVSLMIVALGAGLLSAIPLRPPHRLQAGAAWRLGGLGFATRLLAWMSTNIDTLFASAALGAAGAGIYSRAYNITTQMKEPFAVLDQTTRQAFVAQRSLDDGAASRATLAGLRLVVLMASLVAAGVIVLREALVAVLLGPQWGAVVLPLAILAASLPARVARLYLDGFTFARGSMWHMLLRNLFIVTALAIGLLLWAHVGVAAIALVVCVVQVLSLGFAGGIEDRRLAGPLLKRARAIVPGIMAGTALIVLAEGLSCLSAPVSAQLDWALRGVVWTLTLPAILLFVPDRWLPKFMSAKRKTLMAFGRRKLK